MAGRIGIVVLLSIASIILHEFGHYTVYRSAHVPVRITLQSVRPTTSIHGPVAVLGLAAGPLFSLIAALACLLIARHHPGFFWPTAAFTNATLRLLPCTLDLLYALERSTPFSDEGDIAVMLTHSPIARSLVIVCVFAASTVLTVGTGIVVLLVDELLHPLGG